MITEQKIKDTLIALLNENGREEELEEFDFETNIFEAGILDSITTILFLEKLNENFELSLEGDVLFEEDFQTINGISRIINSKLV